MPQPGAAGSSPADSASLVGPEDSAKGPTPSDQQEQNRNFTAGVKNLHKSLDDFARQYPDMAEACDKSKKLLTDAMVKRMSSGARQSGGGMTPPPLAA